ncbi:hypothetical protein RCF19_30000 [Rhodococcus qingshengii]
MTAALTDRIEKAWRAVDKGDYDDQIADLTQVAIREAAAYFLPRAWTPEELRALPIGTHIADADGDTWKQTEHGFQRLPLTGHRTDGAGVLAEYPPQHITHLPKDTQ